LIPNYEALLIEQTEVKSVQLIPNYEALLIEQTEVKSVQSSYHYCSGDFKNLQFV